MKSSITGAGFPNLDWDTLNLMEICNFILSLVALLRDIRYNGVKKISHSNKTLFRIVLLILQITLDVNYYNYFIQISTKNLTEIHIY